MRRGGRNDNRRHRRGNNSAKSIDGIGIQAGGVNAAIRIYGRPWLKWIFTSGIGLVLSAVSLVWWLRFDDPAGSETNIFNACAAAPKKVAVEVNKPVTLDLHIMPAVAPDCTDIAGKPDPRPVMASRTLTAKLASPAFPGQINLIGQEKLHFEPSSGLPLEWSWEVLGTRPGKYVLSLVVTAVSDDGAIVRYQNPRSTVEVTVTGDLGDTLTLGAVKVDNFLKIIASAVGSIGLIIATIGGWRWHRKRVASRRTGLVPSRRRPSRKRSLLRR